MSSSFHEIIQQIRESDSCGLLFIFVLSMAYFPEGADIP
jgi:hypothetical protein